MALVVATCMVAECLQSAGLAVCMVLGAVGGGVMVFRMESGGGVHVHVCVVCTAGWRWLVGLWAVGAGCVTATLVAPVIVCDATPDTFAACDQALLGVCS